MDIVAHGLWAGLGGTAVAQRRAVSRRAALATMGLAMLPDLAQLLPLVGAALFDGQGPPNAASTAWRGTRRSRWR